jgi:hypothetical protein
MEPPATEEQPEHVGVSMAHGVTFPVQYLMHVWTTSSSKRRTYGRTEGYDGGKHVSLSHIPQ